MSTTWDSRSTWEHLPPDQVDGFRPLVGAIQPLRERTVEFCRRAGRALRETLSRGFVSGSSDVGEWRENTQRMEQLMMVLTEAVEAAEIAAGSGEADPPNFEAWGAALELIVPFIPYVPTPDMTPMQRGVLSVEWRHRGLAVELRFRGSSDLFTVITDADNGHQFMARDHGFKQARNALQALVDRGSKG